MTGDPPRPGFLTRGRPRPRPGTKTRQTARCTPLAWLRDNPGTAPAAALTMRRHAALALEAWTAPAAGGTRVQPTLGGGRCPRENEERLAEIGRQLPPAERRGARDRRRAARAATAPASHRMERRARRHRARRGCHCAVGATAALQPASPHRPFASPARRRPSHGRAQARQRPRSSVWERWARSAGARPCRSPAWPSCWPRTSSWRTTTWRRAPTARPSPSPPTRSPRIRPARRTRNPRSRSPPANH